MIRAPCSSSMPWCSPELCVCVYMCLCVLCVCVYVRVGLCLCNWVKIWLPKDWLKKRQTCISLFCFAPLSTHTLSSFYSQFLAFSPHSHPYNLSLPHSDNNTGCVSDTEDFQDCNRLNETDMCAGKVWLYMYRMCWHLNIRHLKVRPS